jgi:hypothetical protein
VVHTVVQPSLLRARQFLSEHVDWLRKRVSRRPRCLDLMWYVDVIQRRMVI